MPGKVSYRRLVDATPRVHVDRVDHLVCGSIAFGRVLDLILACRRHEQTSIWRESQATEERRQSLIGVEVGIPHAQMRLGRGFHWHDRW